jgi:SAM-dependent methyltransferase
MSFKDYFSTQSVDYKKFRPEYPAAMIDFIVSKCTVKDTAWDCATGTGQVATMLAPHFNKVIATDASEKQIAAAVSTNNIEYKICTAEDSGLPSGYFDLITVAQAAHWFDLPKFYTEVKRVAKPNAVLAVWGYANHSINTEVDAVVSKFYHDILNPYWPKERFIVEQGYKDIVLPFTEIAAPQFSIVKQVNLHELIGYLFTWSATQQYIKQHNQNPIELIYDELLIVWGNVSDEKTISWPVFLKLALVGSS